MENLIWLIPVLPLIGFLVLGWSARLLPRSAAAWLGCATIFAAFGLTVSLGPAVLGQKILEQHLGDWVLSGEWSVGFSLLVDPLSWLMMLVITGVGALIHVYSAGYMHDDERHNHFFAYLNLFVFFMLLLVMGNNFLLLFAGWEGVGLCSYLLIGFWFTVEEYNNAAKKAFIMNRIGDLGFLLGLFLLLQATGGLTYATALDPATLQSVTPGVLTAVALLFIVGAAGKSAQLPLYTWLPDAMAGPTPVSALIHAATMVTAGIYLVLRAHALFELAPLALEVLTYVGLGTSLFAATIGLKQNDIKKVLAYSTVSQLGLMFFALGLGAYTAAFFHLVTHAFFKALLFLGAGSVIHGLDGEQDIRQMGNLRRLLPLTFAVFAIGTLAIAGIPPFSGFFSKDQILLAAYAHHPLLFVVALGASLLTVAYMFRLFFLVFYGTSRTEAAVLAHAHESPVVMTAPLGVLAVLALAGGLLNVPHLFGGGTWLAHFLEPVVGAEHEGHVAVSTEWLLMGVVVALVVGVIFWAYRKYVLQGALPGPEAAETGWGRLLQQKYYVDELYDRLVTRPLNSLSEFTGQVIDPEVVDGVVEGVAGLTQRVGRLIKRLQEGSVGFYLFVFAFGVLLLLILEILL